jgi:hypothetical protein
MVRVFLQRVLSMNDNYTPFDFEKLYYKLEPYQLDFFNERAAIREYDGKYEREMAEYLAMLDTIYFYNLLNE